MIEVTINIPGLKELAEALVLLAGVKSAAVPQQVTIPQPVTSAADYQAASAAPMPASQPTIQAGIPAGVPGTVPTAQAAAVPTAPQTAQATGIPAASAVPTTATGQAYTQDQLAVAMTGLVDQGKMQAVMGILTRMGVQALTEVPRERYPELVLLLREAGAVI